MDNSIQNQKCSSKKNELKTFSIPQKENQIRLRQRLEKKVNKIFNDFLESKKISQYSRYTSKEQCLLKEILELIEVFWKKFLKKKLGEKKLGFISFVPTLVSLWTRISRIVWCMGSNWFWNSCFFQINRLLPSVKVSILSSLLVLGYSVHNHWFLQTSGFLMDQICQWVILVLTCPEAGTHNFSALPCFFSNKVSTNSFSIEVDYSFLRINKNFLYADIDAW